MPGFARWRVRATKIGQEREPAKIAPSGKEPLPKSELAKIKPYVYRSIPRAR